MPSSLDLVISELPHPVDAVYRGLQDHPDVECAALKMQLTVHFRGEKVGGFNRKTRTWYFSKVFVADHGGRAIPERHGFRRILKGPSHVYWARSGSGSPEAFQAALSEMTGVSLQPAPGSSS